MDRILYINKITDTRIREMINVTGDSTNYDEVKISRSIGIPAGWTVETANS